MTLRLSPAELLELVERSDVPCRERLIAAVHTQAEGIAHGRPTPTAHLLRIYSIRFDRWKETGVPKATGFPEFVSALKRTTAPEVAMASLVSPPRLFLLLLSADLTELLGAMEIDKSEAHGSVPHEDSSMRSTIGELFERLRGMPFPELGKQVGNFHLFDSLLAGYASRSSRGERIPTAQIPSLDEETLKFVTELRRKAEPSARELEFLAYVDLQDSIRAALERT